MEVAIKTGLLVYAVGPGPKQWRFWCLSPQTKAINPQRWQRENQHEQDINIKNKKKKEKKKGRVGRRPALKGRGTDDAVATMFLQQYCRNALSSVSGYRPSQANSQEWGNSAEVRGEDPGRILT